MTGPAAQDRLVSLSLCEGQCSYSFPLCSGLYPNVPVCSAKFPPERGSTAFKRLRVGSDTAMWKKALLGVLI